MSIAIIISMICFSSIYRPYFLFDKTFIFVFCKTKKEEDSASQKKSTCSDQKNGNSMLTNSRKCK